MADEASGTTKSFASMDAEAQRSAPGTMHGGDSVLPCQRGKVRLRFVLKDALQRIHTKAKYELDVGEGEPLRGRIPDDGVIDELVSDSLSRIALRAWLDGDDQAPQNWPLEVAPFDPIDLDTGVEARLANLGFADSGQNADEALAAFRVSINRTGDPPSQVDDDTRRQLDRLYSQQGEVAPAPGPSWSASLIVDEDREAVSRRAVGRPVDS